MLLVQTIRYTGIHCYVLKNIKNYLFSKNCKVASNGEACSEKACRTCNTIIFRRYVKLFSFLYGAVGALELIE